MHERIDPTGLGIVHRAILRFVIVDRPLQEVLEDRAIAAIARRHIVIIVDRDIINAIKSLVTEILIIARSGLLIFTQLKIDITQHNIKRDKTLAGTDELLLSTPVQHTYRARCLIERRHGNLFVAVTGLEGFEHLGLTLKNAFIGGHRGIGIDLPDGGHRLCDVRHGAILTSEL